MLHVFCETCAFVLNLVGGLACVADSNDRNFSIDWFKLLKCSEYKATILRWLRATCVLHLSGSWGVEGVGIGAGGTSSALAGRR
jgi:hypothetical protein